MQHILSLLMPENSESHKLILFFVINFGFSWLLWLPDLLSSIGLIEFIPIFRLLRLIGTFGPFITAFFLTYLDQGREGVKNLWKRGWRYDNIPFLLISIFLIPTIFGLTLFLSLLSEAGTITEHFNQMDFGFIFSEFVAIFFFGGPFQEEFGWRGYALDGLQTRWNALESSMMIGGIWAFWHLPLFFIEETPQHNQPFFSFLFFTLILSLFFTWLYNNTNRSIFISMIFHTSTNLSISLFPLSMTNNGNFLLANLLNVVIALILVIYDPKTFTRNSKYDKKNRQT